MALPPAAPSSSSSSLSGGCSGTPTQTSTGTLTAGTATSAPTAALAAGTYSYQAIYQGDDSNFLASTATCQPFTVPVPFIALTPTRLLDTRTPTDITNGHPVGPGPANVITLKVRGTSPASTPVPSTATAVAVNITAVDATTRTFVTVWPHGTTQPTTSNLNLANTGPVANFAIVNIQPDGSIDIYNNAGTANVIIDVVGYYTPTTAYNTLTPTRLLDTRTPTDITNGHPVGPGPANVITLKVRGTSPASTPVPSTATAVAVNITAVDATTRTFVTVWPHGTTQPTTSNLNLANTGPVANFAIVNIQPDGSIDIYNNAGTANVIIDVVGYYTPTTAYNTLTPTRLLDTRTPTDITNGHPVGPGPANVITLKVRGTSPASTPVPSTATAVAVNITAVDATTRTFVTVWPHGTTQPTTSNLNLANTGPVANFAIVNIQPDGSIDIYNNAGTANVIIDVVGYIQ